MEALYTVCLLVVGTTMGHAFIDAVYSGQTHLIPGLYEQRHDVAEVDHSNRTALHVAAEIKNIDAIRLLCECSTTKNFLNHRNTEGLTALHIAVRFKAIAIVALLIEQGASATTSDHAMVTPLHDAVRSGYGRIMHALLEAGASMYVRDSSSYTPLLRSATVSVGIFSRLRRHQSFQGVGQHMTTNRGETILHLAYKANNSELLDFLLESYIFDVNARDCSGNTLLHYAARDGHDVWVEPLLSRYRAYSSQPNIDSQTPLDLAEEMVLPWQDQHEIWPVDHAACVHILRLRRLENIYTIRNFNLINASDHVYHDGTPSGDPLTEDVMRMVLSYL